MRNKKYFIVLFIFIAYAVYDFGGMAFSDGLYSPLVVYGCYIFLMADKMNEMGKEMWIRHVLVPGLTDGKEDLKALRKKLDEWTNVSRVEILPYHTLGLFKWENLGIPYSLEGVSVPTEEQVKDAEEILGIKK